MFEHLIGNNAFRIESPWYLLFLPILLLAFLIAAGRRRPSLVVPSLKPYRSSKIRGSRVVSPILVPQILECLGVVMLIVALIRPQFGIEETVRRTEGIDIMLALDLSGSMKAYDLPDSASTQRKIVKLMESGKLIPRIDVAREEVKAFIDKRPNDRIGVLGFAASTYTVCPPTLDHDFLKSNLDRLEAGMLPDGTGIAAPIANATNRLKESDAKRRVMVLFTDGENNVDAQIAPLQAARIARMFDVVIHTVGIGSRRAVMLRNDMFGRQRLVNAGVGFDQELIEKIAAETGGLYFAARDADGLRHVMNEIDKLEKTSLEQPTYIDYREMYRPWLLAGAVLVLIAFIAEYTVFLKLP